MPTLESPVTPPISVAAAEKAVRKTLASSKIPLLEPSTVKLALAVDDITRQNILCNRNAIRNILSCDGSDNRLMVVVGPCSIHDVDAALHYATLLTNAAELYRRELLIVMRVYIEKPRSTIGWKGLVHEPDHAQTLPKSTSVRGGGQPQLNKGVLISRKVMLEVAQKSLPVATELLNPLLAHYFEDVASLGVIGARTTESQTHREMASSMPMPVGFKNGTDGSLNVAINAMVSASRSHTVVGFDESGYLSYHLSDGNPDTFVILRGGSSGPNFDAEHVREAHAELLRAGKKPCIVVDCSHGNSMKDYRNQGKVAACLAAQIASGVPIKGVMIESNIHEGRQDVPTDNESGRQCLQYGVSITDGCIGWHETSTILSKLATAVRIREQNLNKSVIAADLEPQTEKSIMVAQTQEVAI